MGTVPHRSRFLVLSPNCLEELEELIVRKDDIYKKMVESDDGTMIPQNIRMNEMILSVIENYISGKLMKEIEWLIEMNK